VFPFYVDIGVVAVFATAMILTGSALFSRMK
jgi:hypothetical protein